MEELKIKHVVWNGGVILLNIPLVGTEALYYTIKSRSNQKSILINKKDLSTYYKLNYLN